MCFTCTLELFRIKARCLANFLSCLIDLEEELMMRSYINIIISVLLFVATGSPRSRRPRPPRLDEVVNGRKKPPPPPGAEALSGIIVEGTFNKPASKSRWIWDDNCKNDSPPFELGRWIQVRYEECVKFHDSFCG